VKQGKNFLPESFPPKLFAFANGELDGCMALGLEMSPPENLRDLIVTLVCKTNALLEEHGEVLGHYGQGQSSLGGVEAFADPSGDSKDFHAEHFGGLPLHFGAQQVLDFLLKESRHHIW